MARDLAEHIKRKINQHGVFNNANLASDFIKYFESGERVKVQWVYDNYTEVLTGTIGITTGWKPVFLLMRTSRSMGSPYVIYKDECKVIAVKKGSKYVEVKS